jgi:carboxyl-terminal processing protease
MKRTRYLILPAIALVLVGAVLGVTLNSYVSDGDAFQQLKKLERAFVIINRQYVDPVEAKQVAEEGIAGMLNELDPHSSYIPAEDVRSVRDSYKGSFGGIGIRFDMANDTARVVMPLTNGPSESVGMMAGDRIVEIEDSTAIGLSSRDVQKRLKGPIGTKVDVTVYRPSLDKRFEFTITRDEIPLYSINSAYMVDDRTGYIKIERFAMTTYDEFKEKLKELQGEGMQRLVLDLRNNPGGVMPAAVRIADEMLGRGMKIVETRGRVESANRTFRAASGDDFETQPVIVLVNRSSASASEILAGALQDHDRALIVGERTFGKALVQNQFELNDGSLMQMTIGRYYTPVGRLIQTPYSDGDKKDYYEKKFASYDKALFNPSEYRESIPDSLAYKTDHGRTVFGGGGILPDYVVKPDTTSLERVVSQTGLTFGYVMNWFQSNETSLREQWNERPDAFVEQYTVSDQMVDEFWTYAEEQGLEFTSVADSVDRKEGVFPAQEADDAREFVRTHLKGNVARQLYGARAMYPIFNSVNPTFQEAMKLWDRADQLAAYHDPAASTTNAGDGPDSGR